MTVREAAEHVLRAAREPLTTEEIARRIVGEGHWRSAGKTPHATVTAQISTDIKKRGDGSPFVRVGPNTFALRENRGVPKQKPVGPRRSTPTFSFIEAAEKVLDQFGNNKPLHYREITEKALELGWLVTEGRTPEATMYAQVLTEIRRQQKRGKQPRFVQHGRGYVGLSRWMGKGLAFDIEQHNRRVRQALHKRLLAMEWHEFEELITRLLVEMGFEDVEATRRSGDGGIDVRGTLVVGDAIRTRMAVQVKKWKRNVQAPIVQQVRGSLGTHEQGLIITTSNFGEGARKEAARANAVPVALMNGEQLVALLASYGIGVSRQAHEIIELEQSKGDGVQEADIARDVGPNKFLGERGEQPSTVR